MSGSTTISPTPPVSDNLRQIEASLYKIKSLIFKLEVDLGIAEHSPIKQQALDALDRMPQQNETETIRRALEQLPNDN